MASQKKIEKKAKRDKLRRAERRVKRQRTQDGIEQRLSDMAGIPSLFMTGLNP